MALGLVLDWQHILSVCEDVGCGVGFGALIGLERQWRSSVAGLRTNALVALGAALFVSLEAAPGKQEYRIAAQVVSGIGFIGGGAILREGFTIRGVNTAATLWCSAAIGVLCGIGMRWQAALGTAFVLLTNVLLRPITYYMSHGSHLRSDVETHYSVSVKCSCLSESRIRRAIIGAVEARRLLMRSLRSEAGDPSGVVTVTGMIVSSSRVDGVMEDVVQEVRESGELISVEWGIAAQSNE